jgi:protein-tyrosine phosphatase
MLTDMSSERALTNPRVHAVSGAHNLRDLGGLATRSGREVLAGRIFRSDYPAFVEVEADAVQRLALRTVVDLRRGTEAGLECVDWARRGIGYRRWPLTAGSESSWSARYPAYLIRRPDTVVGAVREVMRPEGHAVLFHCAAGKDRTGVVAALLLSVLGVSDDDIVSDHLMSAESVEAVLTRLVEMDLYAAMLVGSSVEDQLPKADHMQALLDWLAERGGTEAWLVDQGVPDAELVAFRDAMLVG